MTDDREPNVTDEQREEWRAQVERQERDPETGRHWVWLVIAIAIMLVVYWNQ